MTPSVKKVPIKLPPKPVTKDVVKTAVSAKAKYKSISMVKAKEIRITLEDDTMLVANGGLAADIYAYLMDCERYCAGHPGTVAPYVGKEMWSRLDPEGKEIK